MLHDTRDGHRDHAIARRACPSTRREATIAGYRIMEADAASPAARRWVCRSSAHARAIAPNPRRPRISWESVIQTPDRRKAGPHPGRPPCFIQEEKEDGAVRSPGLKHARPVRANRCVGLSCLLCSSFSYPPDSRARRARPSPDGSNPRTAHAQPLTLFRPAFKRFSGIPESIDDLPDDPCTELIDRISLTISSRQVPNITTAFQNSPIPLISQRIR